MPITKLETVLRGQLSGLTINNDAGDLNNDINFGVGVAADSTAFANITLTSAIVKRLDAVWTAGTNGGGLDTGTKTSSQTYHCYVIKNPVNGLVDALFSLSATSPTLPSGYTLFRRVAGLYTDASANWVQFTQHGDYFYPVTTQVGYSVSNVGVVSNTAIGIGFVPQGIQVKLLGQGYCSAVNNQSTGYAWISAAGQNAAAAETLAIGGNAESTILMCSGAHTGGEASANWHQNQTTFCLLTNTSAQIILTTSTSIGGNVNVRIRVMGWIDARGNL